MASNTDVELWILLAFGVFFTILRTYARVSAVGFRGLHADDYLIWIAILMYTTQTLLGYNVGTVAHGLANNGMTDTQRSMLSHNDPEYTRRVIGSKIQVAGWTTAACLLWTLKLCVSIFYLRLTSGLEKYQRRIYVAMAIIAATFVAVIMTIYLSCRPFHRYWQINPDPGNSCQPAISEPIIWVSFVSNVSTDAFLLFLPITMLWKSSLRLDKKVAATLVLSAGVLIIICATLKSIYVIVDPVNGGQLAAEWGIRETHVAVVTTNLPMIFPLFKTWLAPLIPNFFRSSSNNKAYKMPGSGFVTIGGGGGASSHNRRGTQNAGQTTANMTFDNESEEHITTKSNDVKMQHLGTTTDSEGPHTAIVVSKQITVTTESRGNKRSTESFHAV